MNRVRFLRGVGLWEGASYLLLLFVAMPMKYLFDQPWAVRYTGMAHGVLFILFLYALFIASSAHKWPIQRSFIVLVAALLPFGPLFVDRMLKRESQKAAADS